MTRAEELANQLTKCVRIGMEPYDCFQVPSSLMADVVAKLLETDWIPVTERLPDKEGFYLGTKKDTIGGRHYQDVVYWLGYEWATFSIVTAWMPLPDVYEGG